MQTENEIEAGQPGTTENFLPSDEAACSGFEAWWQEYGLRAEPQVLEKAYKEIALMGWVARETSQMDFLIPHNAIGEP